MSLIVAVIAECRWGVFVEGRLTEQTRNPERRIDARTVSKREERKVVPYKIQARNLKKELGQGKMSAEK